MRDLNWIKETLDYKYIGQPCVVCLFVFVGILDRFFQRPNLVNL
jgi:hypothetical protein